MSVLHSNGKILVFPKRSLDAVVMGAAVPQTTAEPIAMQPPATPRRFVPKSERLLWKIFRREA